MAVTLTYTAGEMCTEALREAGVISIDRAATSEEMDVAIKALNRMLKSWQNTAVTIWKQTTGSITVTDATTSYTITTRPLTLDTVNRRNTSGTDIWLYPMSRQEYQELPDKDAAGSMTQYYYERGLTTGILFIWPVMTTGTGTIEWSGRDEVADITATTDAVEVPSEWYDATHYGLALRLSGLFSTTRPLIAPMAEKTYNEAVGADVDESIYFEPDYYG